MTALKRPSLRFLLVIFVVLPLAVAAGVVSYFLLREFEERVEIRMEDEVQLVARAIRLPVSNALARGSEGRVREALESAIGINRVYGAYVYDSDGNMTVSAGAVNVAPDERRISDLAEEGDRRGAYERIAGRNVYSYFVPLTTAGGRTTGLLHVTRRARDIREGVTRLRWQVGGILLAAIAVMSGLVLYGHHGAVGRYLDRLGTSMRRVERGERGHRAALDGPREITTVARALNMMLDSIARAEEEITERSAAQRELEKELEHAEKLAALGRLAAGVAHELGTPLSVIDGKAQRALRRDELGPAAQGTLEEVRTEVRRMEHIVRQLLDFGRKHTLRRRSIAADRLAHMAAAAVRDELERTNVHLVVEGPEPAPTLHVDPIRIEQALTNLLHNAMEAAHAGTITLSWFADDAHAGFCVDDDGPGVAEEVRPHLFEPFFTTKDVGEGTGLGLAVVHGIAEEHQGTVTVGRSESGGARFCLSLPHDHISDEAPTSS